MSSHPRRDTGPELAVRRLLHAAGARYRVCYKIPSSRRRSIDIAFRRAMVAVFIDGCFWHGCPVHGQVPTANRDWWIAKIEKNRARDINTTELLQAEGWQVLRFWEHESAVSVAATVLAAVRGARG